MPTEPEQASRFYRHYSTMTLMMEFSNAVYDLLPAARAFDKRLIL